MTRAILIPTAALLLAGQASALTITTDVYMGQKRVEVTFSDLPQDAATGEALIDAFRIDPDPNRFFFNGIDCCVGDWTVPDTYGAVGQSSFRPWYGFTIDTDPYHETLILTYVWAASGIVWDGAWEDAAWIQTRLEDTGEWTTYTQPRPVFHYVAPEPAAAGLLPTGAAAVAFRRRR